jgi:hypothetical protein
MSQGEGCEARYKYDETKYSNVDNRVPIGNELWPNLVFEHLN